MTRQEAELLIAERVVDKLIGHIVDAEVALAIASANPAAASGVGPAAVRLVEKNLLEMRRQVLPPALSKLASLRAAAAGADPETPRP